MKYPGLAFFQSRLHLQNAHSHAACFRTHFEDLGAVPWLILFRLFTCRVEGIPWPDASEPVAQPASTAGKTTSPRPKTSSKLLRGSTRKQKAVQLRAGRWGGCLRPPQLLTVDFI